MASLKIRRMTDLSLAGQRVLIREDLNVPIKNGRATSAARIATYHAGSAFGAGFRPGLSCPAAPALSRARVYRSLREVDRRVQQARAGLQPLRLRTRKAPAA